MKKTLAISSLLMVLGLSSCIKEVLKKKEPPEEKYFGKWNGAQAAVDLNGNNTIDNNELVAFQGSSLLELSSNKTFNYSISSGGSSTSLSGSWTMGADQKSVTITDPAQGSIRFDQRSDLELQTEPIVTNGTTVWFIYKKQ